RPDALVRELAHDARPFCCRWQDGVRESLNKEHGRARGIGRQVVAGPVAVEIGPQSGAVRAAWLVDAGDEGGSESRVKEMTVASGQRPRCEVDRRAERGLIAKRVHRAYERGSRVCWEGGRSIAGQRREGTKVAVCTLRPDDVVGVTDRLRTRVERDEPVRVA